MKLICNYLIKENRMKIKILVKNIKMKVIQKKSMIQILHNFQNSAEKLVKENNKIAKLWVGIQITTIKRNRQIYHLPRFC